MDIRKASIELELQRDDPYFSLSRLHCFSRCPKQYYYRYIEQRREPLKYSPLSGAALHKGLEEHNKKRFFEGKKSSLKEILEVAREYIRTRYKSDDHAGAEVREDQAVDATVTDGKPPTSEYCKKVESGFTKVEAVEDEMRYQLEGAEMLGYADLVTDELVIDYKLLARRRAKDEVTFDPQLNLYRIHYKRPAAFIQLLRRKECAELVIAEISDGTQAATVSWVADTIKAIKLARKTGVFPRQPAASFACRTCPFKSLCNRR